MAKEPITRIKTWVKVRKRFCRMQAKKSEINTADSPSHLNASKQLSILDAESLSSLKESRASINRSYWMFLIPSHMREEIGGDFQENYQALKAEGKSFPLIHMRMIENLILLWVSMLMVWIRALGAVLDSGLDNLALKLREVLIALGLW